MMVPYQHSYHQRVEKFAEIVQCERPCDLVFRGLPKDRRRPIHIRVGDILTQAQPFDVWNEVSGLPSLPRHDFLMPPKTWCLGV